MGALTENHRCRRGMVSRVSHALSTVAVGSGLGTVACFAIEDRPAAGALLVAAAALGVVLATAVREAVEGRR